MSGRAGVGWIGAGLWLAAAGSWMSLVVSCASQQDGSTGANRADAQVTTVAMQVYDLETMAAFYRDAFGVQFRQVDTSGILSLFGELDGITLKLVPIREAPDFVGYPSHQLGVEVADVEGVIEIAERYGGRKEGTLTFSERRVRGAIRDPDGNTIELYGPIRGG